MASHLNYLGLASFFIIFSSGLPALLVGISYISALWAMLLAKILTTKSVITTITMSGFLLILNPNSVFNSQKF